MKKNVGTIDRIVRFIVAAAFSYLFFTGVISGALGIALLVVAGVMALTSISSRCPMYSVFGMDTCEASAKAV